MSKGKQLIDRITEYLASGGLFNPELADHSAVRDLLIECRDELSRTFIDQHSYSEQYDAFYDNTTGEWTESKCSDPTCEFCVGRPDKVDV